MFAKTLFNSPSRPVRKEARTSAKPGELHGPLHERERLPLQVSILIGEVWGVIRVVVIAVVMGGHDALQRSNTSSTYLE